eukprot:CAMPEP_0184484166 /NCGR_PEP_ID=MMETSP0113_2-20130426/5879_1 /TAXON_ID=91329 /ORGANISM="Norrisiella sphaerica, Strain BC52" /LENGTH=37 /DNA_ID= /DNA_START= /DNA_END= /DNA_ORIENTATION=
MKKIATKGLFSPGKRKREAYDVSGQDKGTEANGIGKE